MLHCKIFQFIYHRKIVIDKSEIKKVNQVQINYYSYKIIYFVGQLIIYPKTIYKRSKKIK